MRRLLFAWFTLSGLVFASCTMAQEPARFALLIGNQSYKADVGPLTNPQNDVALLERALTSIGFKVTTVKDVGFASLYQAVNAHVRRLQAAGPGAVGFLYYSGHGAANEDNGADYLIPVDVSSVDSGELWDSSIRLGDITSKLKAEAGNATHFVVVDACRNKLRLRKASSKALMQAKGFRPVQGESGMLIAFATAEGELSSDEGNGAGPYSRVLAEEIVRPNTEAVAVFRHVQVRVRQAIGQEPWLGFNALGEVFLAGLTPPSVSSSSAAPSASDAPQAWAMTQNTTSQAVLEEFIRRYGDTYYAALARARLDELKKSQKGQVAVVAPPGIAGGPAVARNRSMDDLVGSWCSVERDYVFARDKLIVHNHGQTSPGSVYRIARVEASPDWINIIWEPPYTNTVYWKFSSDGQIMYKHANETGDLGAEEKFHRCSR
jgi:uncharacterized caspase-like protein